MSKAKSFVLLLSLLLPACALAKGDGVALRMEGKVSNVVVEGEKLSFVLTGGFFFKQWRRDSMESSRQNESSVEVDGSRGIQVTVMQNKPFYAMTEDGRGAAIRDDGALAGILQAAARQGRVVKFQLIDANLVFSRGGGFRVARAAVIRATDADLR